jgi:hypothetical protein
MSKAMLSINDLISLTVMFLMIVALVAAQANATDYQEAVAEITETVSTGYEAPALPLQARVKAQFDAADLTISIDASAEIRRWLLDKE